MPTSFPAPTPSVSTSSTRTAAVRGHGHLPVVPDAASVIGQTGRSRPRPGRQGRTPGPPAAVVHLRDVPKSGGVLTTVLWVGGFALVLAGVVAAVTFAGRPRSRPASETTNEKFNLPVEPFPAGGRTTDPPAAALAANILGRTRSQPGWRGWRSRRGTGAIVSRGPGR